MLRVAILGRRKSPVPVPASATQSGQQTLKGTKQLDDLVAEFHLLDHYKVITDQVWDEIWITELEASMMDTVEFQRLHWVLQLGSSIFVYPTASHTRFEHALGTLEAADRIVRACIENSQTYATPSIGPYSHVLCRLAALLHDLAQMPYAHTLDHDGEGHLIETEWKNTTLRRDLLAAKRIENKVEKIAFMERQLRNFFEEKMGPTRKNEIDQIVENLRADLEWILCDSSRDKLPSSPNKYYLRPLADIVGNTVCADLIDYVQRDLLSAGFRDRISLRPLHFFLIQNFTEKTNGNIEAPRLILASWKKTKPDKMRRDVITEAIELLRKRYSLGERVYFHHAKMAAAAMVIKAVALSGLKCEDVWSHGDYSLLRYLIDLKDPNGNDHPSASIIKALLKRDLFKTAYELRHKEKPEPGDPVESVKDDYARGKAASVRQRKLEDDIAMCVGISSNDIVVYSPDPDMNTKEFRALVWPKEAAKIVRLEALGEAKPESDELQRKHRSLWRLSVFVRREALTPEVRRNIRTFCVTFLEQQSPEPEILADLYWKSHRAQLSPGPNPDDRDLAVNVVIQALAKSMRSGNNSPLFPTLQEVQEEVKRRKAVGGVLPAK